MRSDLVIDCTLPSGDIEAVLWWAFDNWPVGEVGPLMPYEAHLVIDLLDRMFDHVIGLRDEELVSRMLADLANIDPIDGSGQSIGVRSALAYSCNPKQLLIACAKKRQPPDLDLRRPKCARIKRKNGAVLVVREAVDGRLIEAWGRWRNDFVGAPRCPLAWENPTIKEIAEQRAEYTLWWRSAALLADQLNQLLAKEDHGWRRGCRTARPVRPERPWELERG